MPTVVRSTNIHQYPLTSIRSILSLFVFFDVRFQRRRSPASWMNTCASWSKVSTHPSSPAPRLEGEKWGHGEAARNGESIPTNNILLGKIEWPVWYIKPNQNPTKIQLCIKKISRIFVHSLPTWHEIGLQKFSGISGDPTVQAVAGVFFRCGYS